MAVAAVVGGEDETAWFGRMSCASGKIVAADLVHGSSARLGKLAAKTAGESLIVLVATSLIEVVSRAMDVVFDFAEARRTSCV